MPHHYQDLIDIFHRTFSRQFNTRLVRGEDEPIYLPASDDVSYHQIIFAHGYFTSALHEIAHWCIAGPERQLKEDWGYWYIPDGRTAKQQQRFELVEIKPQAVEWAFCLACGIRFNESADNLSGVETDRLAFRAKVYQQLQWYFVNGFPSKAQQFIDALLNHYQPDVEWNRAFAMSLEEV